MLVLSRDEGQSIKIVHNNVVIMEISLQSVKGKGRARLGIVADKSYVALRNELCEARVGASYTPDSDKESIQDDSSNQDS
jgi:sRNA-binding carbon storage regulator CsrA